MNNEKEIVDRYRTGLCQMFLTLTGSETGSEELVDETLTLVLQKLRNEGVGEMGRLSGFIYSTARYVYLSWLRRAEGRASIISGNPPQPYSQERYRALSAARRDSGSEPIAEAV